MTAPATSDTQVQRRRKKVGLPLPRPQLDGRAPDDGREAGAWLPCSRRLARDRRIEQDLVKLTERVDALELRVPADE
jgi:hypothetical protein